MPRLFLAASALPLLAFSSTSTFAAATSSFFAPHILFSPQPYLLAAIAMIGLLGLIFHRRVFFRIGALMLVALLVTSVGLDLAFAADGAPETVAQAAGETAKVTWAWGALVSQCAEAVAWLLLSVLLYFARQLPANLVAVFGNARVELLLQNAVNYGVNAVAGAVKDKKLEVEVGNQVLAQALQYAVDNAPGWLQAWAGGPEGLAKKIWGRLNLGEGADASAIAEIVDQVQKQAA